jgi:hypothetical protein
VKIDHIAFVVADRERYRRALPPKRVLRSLYDRFQGAQLELLDAGNVYIELIEPKVESSFTWRFLEKGGGFHHICYEVSSEDEARSIIRENRMIEVLGPVYAPLLEGTVLFARSPNREMVEYVWRR